MNDHLGLGAYLLGGLSPQDTRAFETHLSGCRQCQLELEQFAPVASRLGVLSATDASTLLAPQDTEFEAVAPTELLAALGAKRRSRKILQRAGFAATVAASVVAGVVLAPVLNPAPAPDASFEVLSGTGQQVGVGLNAKAWGTEVLFDGSGLPTEGTLSLWVVDGTGSADRAVAWSATGTGTTRMTGAVPVPLDQIAAIQLRDVDSRVLAEVALPAQPS